MDELWKVITPEQVNELNEVFGEVDLDELVRIEGDEVGEKMMQEGVEELKAAIKLANSEGQGLLVSIG